MGVATLFTQQGHKKVSMMSQWSQCRVMMMSQGHIEVIAPHPCITHHRFIKNICSNLIISSQRLSKFSLSHACSLPVGANMTFKVPATQRRARAYDHQSEELIQTRICSRLMWVQVNTDAAAVLRARRRTFPSILWAAAAVKYLLYSEKDLTGGQLLGTLFSACSSSLEVKEDDLCCEWFVVCL